MEPSNKYNKKKPNNKDVGGVWSDTEPNISNETDDRYSRKLGCCPLDV